MDENSNRSFDLDDSAEQSRTTSPGEDDSPTKERCPTSLLPMLTDVDPHPVYVPGERQMVNDATAPDGISFAKVVIDEAVVSVVSHPCVGMKMVATTTMKRRVNTR